MHNGGIGDGGWGIGDGGWGIGPNPQSPIPNPQSPIPLMQFTLFILYHLNNNYFIKKKKKNYIFFIKMGMVSHSGTTAPFHSIRLPKKYTDWSFDKNKSK